jgi:hypothetical protein
VEFVLFEIVLGDILVGGVLHFLASLFEFAAVIERVIHLLFRGGSILEVQFECWSKIDRIRGKLRQQIIHKQKQPVTFQRELVIS